MKRPLRALAGAALLALGAVGCGGGAGDPTGGSAGDDAGEQAGPKTLVVFAAASLQEAFDDLLAQFGEEHPEVDIVPAVYEGSATLVTQLQEGAGADVLATANEPIMAEAVEAGVVASPPELFASNDLVIAVPAGNPHGITDLRDVLDLDYAACAEQVPCGEATARLFEEAGLSADPISEEQSVTAVANRVSAGEVEAGFVYRTDVAARPELTGISPAGARIVNHYPIAAAAGSEAGRGFVDFVLSEQGRAVLESYGFGEP